jgi:hypothetical protein
MKQMSKRLPAVGLLLGVALGSLVVASGCGRGPATVMAELREANRLSADVRVQFNKAAGATKGAVMADTDEASLAFARDAKLSGAAVEHDMAALKALLAQLGVSDEVALLQTFSERYSAYRKVDDTVLALAVQNTNLKAQGLEFGPEREAADRFKAALTAPAASLPAKDRCRADASIASAVLAVRELQTLQGPHIASADDAAMSALEHKIADLEATTADALRSLSGLVEPSALTTAQTAFDQFKSIGSQIVVLSRQNSNVRSLDLALRVAPPLAAACDESLRALQQALANEGSKATR